MQIHCENCGATIPGANINIQEKLAVCPECGSVFSFADHLNKPTPARKFKPPKTLSVIEKNNSLEIQFRWRQILKEEEHWFTVACAFGTLLLGRLAYAMYDGLDTILEGALGVAFLLGALVCLYLVLMVLLNKVSITIDNQTIRSDHKPLPLNSKTIKRTDVVGVNCEVASYNKDDPDSELADYNVQILRHDGHKDTLIAIRRDVAFYIAQVIEDYLHGDEIVPYDADTEDEDASLLEQAENKTARNSAASRE